MTLAGRDVPDRRAHARRGARARWRGAGRPGSATRRRRTARGPRRGGPRRPRRCARRGSAATGGSGRRARSARCTGASRRPTARPGRGRPSSRRRRRARSTPGCWAISRAVRRRPRRRRQAKPSRSLIAATIAAGGRSTSPPSQPTGRPSTNGSASPPLNGSGDPHARLVAGRVAMPDDPLAVRRDLARDQPDGLVRDLATLAGRAVPGVELVDAALRRGVHEPVRRVRGPGREADDRGAPWSRTLTISGSSSAMIPARLARISGSACRTRRRGRWRGSRSVREPWRPHTRTRATASRCPSSTAQSGWIGCSPGSPTRRRLAPAGSGASLRGFDASPLANARRQRRLISGSSPASSSSSRMNEK